MELPLDLSIRKTIAPASNDVTVETGYVPDVNDCSFSSPCTSVIDPEGLSSEVTRQHGDIRVTLVDANVWEAFSSKGTEMIINKHGRRMFPRVTIAVSGLSTSGLYNISLEIVPADDRRYKYVQNAWLSVCQADPSSPSPPYLHPDSPNTGSFWMQKTVFFENLKLTNNRDSSEGNICLQSMHKYNTRIHITEAWTKGHDEAATASFNFDETTFIAVTVYQNVSITKLKIHNNPFAKAFRDKHLSLNQTRNKVSSKSSQEGTHDTDHIRRKRENTRSIGSVGRGSTGLVGRGPSASMESRFSGSVGRAYSGSVRSGSGGSFGSGSNGSFGSGSNESMRNGSNGSVESGSNGSFESKSNCSFKSKSIGSVRIGSNGSFRNGSTGSVGSGSNDTFGSGSNGSFGSGSDWSVGSRCNVSDGSEYNGSVGSGSNGTFGSGFNGSFGRGSDGSVESGSIGAFGCGSNGSFGRGSDGSDGSKSNGTFGSRSDGSVGNRSNDTFGSASDGSVGGRSNGSDGSGYNDSVKSSRNFSPVLQLATSSAILTTSPWELNAGASAIPNISPVCSYSTSLPPLYRPYHHVSQHILWSVAPQIFPSPYVFTANYSTSRALCSTTSSLPYYRTVTRCQDKPSLYPPS